MQPTKVLGIYTFTKRVALEEFENKPRKQQGYSTVSHFNIVHYDCHLAAVRYVLTISRIVVLMCMALGLIMGLLRNWSLCSLQIALVFSFAVCFNVLNGGQA